MDKFNREENKSQQMIISALSHDLRSPLSVINMLAGAIINILEEDKNNTEDAIKMSEMIMEKSSSMMFMLENLLKYCKMCSINPVIEEIDLKATPHNHRLPPLPHICLQIFRHIAQKLLDLRQ